MVNPRKKGVIYTALIGDYDNIVKIKKNENWDYVMYTNVQLRDLPKDSGWCYKSADMSISEKPHLVNRWYKMHPHLLFSEYFDSIYIDSNININEYSFIDRKVDYLRLNNISFSIPDHVRRNCIYKEAKRVVKVKKDTEENVKKIINHIRLEGYPESNGLLENNFIYRMHNLANIKTLMEDWWSFVNCYSNRDQLSLCYILWKHGVDCDRFFGDGLSIRDRKDITLQKHKSFEKNSKIKSIIFNFMRYLK